VVLPRVLGPGQRPEHLEGLDALLAEALVVEDAAARGEVNQYLGLHPVGEGQPRLLFQQVDGPLPEGRLHLDLDTEDLDGDVARAVALGATVVREVTEIGMRWTVMLDPEGNTFCLCTAAA
jgi:hypothetical protein